MFWNKDETNKKTKVVIVGAGPAGLLLGHYLVRRPNYEILLVEKRSDPRQATDEASLRTYPIALQSRGMHALKKIPGLDGTMTNQGVHCVGVCLHGAKKTRTIPRDPPNLSLDRNQIAMTLLKELALAELALNTTISMQFDAALQDVNPDSKEITIVNEMNKPSKISFDYLVAADGGRSKIRQQLADMGALECSQKEIPDDYRTIHLPRTSQDGSLQLDSDKIHGWMLDKIKIITAPIHKDYVSGAIIFDKGQDPFAGMQSSQDVLDYFQGLSPNSLGKLMTEPDAAQLLASPTSTLLSVRCQQLHAAESVLLLGDAAHAVSASVGQGCNSALQDVEVFGALLDQYEDDWTKVLPAYTLARLEDAHAVSDLSDYSNARSKWMKVEWLLRIILKKVLPKWLSSWCLRPMPMELLSETSLSYTDVLEQTKWWIDRVKRSQE
jgi:kynurenine 3-monooxygenase